MKSIHIDFSRSMNNKLFTLCTSAGVLTFEVKIKGWYYAIHLGVSPDCWEWFVCRAQEIVHSDGFGLGPLFTFYRYRP